MTWPAVEGAHAGGAGIFLPDAHRRNFPDGRVGSHAALATRVQGEQLRAAAMQAVAEDYRAFV